MIKNSLSFQRARKLALLSQRIPPAKQAGRSLDATLSVIEHLGYIQIDTISAIQRAHHHTIWNRNPRYTKTHLDKLIRDKQVYEYWSHAAAYLPMRDYRYSLIRKKAIASGDENHWYMRDKKLMKYVLDRIANDGPLMAKDFEHKGEKLREWQTKAAKQALENLFMQGELMISHRINFHKVYDLPERVLPSNIDTSEPTRIEYARFLITRFLKANGLGQASEITYLLKNIKLNIVVTLNDMSLNNELLQLSVGNSKYYALPESLELISKPLPRSKLKILSPFDNLIIQRKRVKELFGFDYMLECYVTEAKRKFGYFVLPILWDGKLVARMDCKAERKMSTLHINHLALEPGLKKIDAFIMALKKELISFLDFNQCNSIQIHKTDPTNLKPLLIKSLEGII